MIIERLQHQATAAEAPVKMAPPGAYIGRGEGSLTTRSGQTVTAESARKIATAYRCDNLLSDDIALMPLQTYIMKPGGEVQRFNSNATLKNIAYRLEVSPNDQGWMTPFLFKKMMIQWQLRWGNALVWSPPDPTRPKYLLRVDWSYPEFDSQGNLYYHTVFPDGSQDDIPAVEVLHLMINPHRYGYWGQSVLSFARETLGRQLGAYEARSAIHKKGLMPGFIAKVPGQTTRETRRKIRDEYEEAVGGSSSAGALVILGQDEFVSFEAVSMKPVDLQFLETVDATNTEICNFYGVPEYKVNAGKQSYESNAQQDLDYMKSSLNPLAVPIEQAARLKWLTVEEQAYMYFKFNRDAILQTDAKTRAEYLAKKIGSGQMTPDEARQIEDMPARGADMLFIPVNLAPINKPVKPPAKTKGGA